MPRQSSSENELIQIVVRPQESNEAVLVPELLRRIATMNKDASELAHEVRNILNVIQGYADLLNEPAVTESKRREYTGHITTAVAKTAACVQQWRSQNSAVALPQGSGRQEPLPVTF
jgi:signal transduction histidine kinase